MIVLGKMGHKTWMLLRLSLPIQYPQRQVLGIRGSAHRDLSGLFPGKASLILNAHTQLARLLLPFVPHILKTISPVPCIVETIFLVWLFLKAERKMWVFVGLRFPIQYPLRQVRIVSQDRISGKRPKYFCQILEFAQMIHFLIYFGDGIDCR